MACEEILKVLVAIKLTLASVEIQRDVITYEILRGLSTSCTREKTSYLVNHLYRSARSVFIFLLLFLIIFLT